MVESSFQNLVAVKRLPDSLVAQLRNLTTSLMEQGYADHTVRLKLRLLTNFGQWLTRKNLSVADLDERLLDAFLKGKHRVDRGESKNLQQFLDHLRRHNVVPARNPARDGSPLADILNRYETHLRTERGLVPVTIRRYLPFLRQFLLERFRGRPFLLEALKASDNFRFCFAAQQQHGRQNSTTDDHGFPLFLPVPISEGRTAN